MNLLAFGLALVLKGEAPLREIEVILLSAL
jgi:hypothetical protein